MVKNFGGKHGKKIARKNTNSNNEANSNRKLRFANGSDELYGLVTKCLGNGQFLIMCIDQVERLCIIRNKFTGRNKQGNMISIGSWVIIGVRAWETSKPNKKDKCDMLEVYTNNEKHKLLEESKISLSFLIQQENQLLNLEETEEVNEYITFSEGGGDDNNEQTTIAGLDSTTGTGAEDREADAGDAADNDIIDFDEI